MYTIPQISFPMGFNPRPRTGSDQYLAKTKGGYQSVSIHAPARGATPDWGNTRVEFIVSIHAPARGATLLGTLLHVIKGVSIHAPARGATVH